MMSYVLHLMFEICLDSVDKMCLHAARGTNWMGQMTGLTVRLYAILCHFIRNNDKYLNLI